jgi:hypothetical protein
MELSFRQRVRLGVQQADDGGVIPGLPENALLSVFHRGRAHARNSQYIRALWV